ncbi:hypothetical protein E4T80_11940 [Muribacter muris]|uniref:Uncharacterized protein n=1 Tax=Muribacter muris TaxID=67855 RepID=A0A4Y9JT99_9PAST|nr:hypothetical protein [Muribacter muris]MBF0786172.1 hypothetical protein [Muribacter muris]MBF0828297.1 hypothetical protein [Muribacter muris]TFV07696.1 hypothetical protein E4T80_11940 [Muribacter muris]
MTRTFEPKSKVFKRSDGYYYGEIYADGKVLERTSGYFSELNCITYLNQRVDYWNARKNLQIPKYIKKD